MKAWRPIERWASCIRLKGSRRSPRGKARARIDVSDKLLGALLIPRGPRRSDAAWAKPKALAVSTAIAARAQHAQPGADPVHDWSPANAFEGGQISLSPCRRGEPRQSAMRQRENQGLSVAL